MFSHSRGPGARASERAGGRRRRFLHSEAGAWAADRRRRTSRSGRGAGDERRAAERAATGGGRGPVTQQSCGDPSRRARAQAAGPPRRAARAALRTLGARAPLAAGGNAPASGPRRPTGRGRRAKGGWGAGGGRTGVAAAAGPDLGPPRARPRWPARAHRLPARGAGSRETRRRGRAQDGGYVAPVPRAAAATTAAAPRAWRHPGQAGAGRRRRAGGGRLGRGAGPGR